MVQRVPVGDSRKGLRSPQFAHTHFCYSKTPNYSCSYQIRPVYRRLIKQLINSRPRERPQMQRTACFIIRDEKSKVVDGLRQDRRPRPGVARAVTGDEGALHEASPLKLSEQKGSKHTVLSQDSLTFGCMSDLKTLIINQPKNAPFCPCKAGGPEKHFLISLNQRLHQ